MNGSSLDEIELTDGRRVRGFADEGYGYVVDTFVYRMLWRRYEKGKTS